MRKFSVFIKNFFATTVMQEALDKKVIESTEVAPGQLRKRGDWYYLTLLRVCKVKNWNAVLFDLEDKEYDSTRVVLFQIKENKLLIRGGKGDHKDLFTYFQAVALELISGLPEKVDPTKIEEIYKQFYRIESPIVDLDITLSKFEAIEAIKDIKKLRMKKVEIAVGNIQNCVVNTKDYGGAKKILSTEEETAFGVEFEIKEPDKTMIYYDLDGQVRVATKNDDVDLERLAIGCAMKL